MQVMTKRESGPRPDPAGSTPAARRADQLVAAVRDDPAQRLRLAAGFYDQRVGGRSIRAYRRAEIAFMRTVNGVKTIIVPQPQNIPGAYLAVTWPLQ
jgi:hypothetical protein